MLNTFKNCFNVSFSEGGNIFIYFLKRVPLIGKRISNAAYKQTEAKVVFGLIQFMFSIIRSIIFKGLYFGLIIYAPSIFITEVILNNNVEFNEIFLQLFFILNFLLGSFINSIIFTKDDKPYKMIKLMRVNPKKYYFGQIIYKIITQFIYYLPILVLVQLGFLNSIILLLELSAFRIFGEWTRLLLYKKSKFILGESIGISAVFLISIAIIPALLLNLWGTVNLSSILYNKVIIVAILSIGVLFFINIWRYKGYTSLSRKVLTEEFLNKKSRALKEMKVADIKLDEKKMNERTLNSKKYDNKKGYDYLNSVFFLRHSSLVRKPILIMVIIITVVFIFALIGALFIIPENKIEMIDAIKGSAPFMVFLLYFTSSTERLCKAMFFNCDISLLRYGFYKNGKGILENFRSRLKKMISFNIIPSVTIITLLSIFVLIIGGISDFISIIPILICIITLALFFSIYGLFMYYILQPYTAELTVKSPLFKLSNFMLYILCYGIFQIETSSVYFTLVVIVITVMFVPISLFLVYKYAPKTFKLK